MKDLKMERYFLFGILLVLCCFKSIGQTELNKHEIVDYWIRFNKPKQGKGDISKNLIGYDAGLNKKVSAEMDNLRKLHIDTIGVFVQSFPGLMARDSCKKGNYPSDIFVFWKFKNKKNCKKITNHCESDLPLMNSSIFFDYYQANLEAIKDEYILPVIFKAEMDKGNKVTYSGESIDHEPRYIIYCQTGNEYKLLNFAQSDFINKRSLFYEDNINSKVYNWFLLIQNEVRRSF